MDAASSSADAKVTPRHKYDVFISFRGTDTRRTFTSHLFDALSRKKIFTYIDVRLETGDAIGPALLTAIEQSKLSIIIFSKDYASSSWCLDELVHILKWKEEHQQLVVPVFYEIDPSNVRRQKGNYADSFVVLEERYNMEKVQKWRDALRTAADLSGVDSQNFRNEVELVKTIVEDVSTKLKDNSTYVVAKSLKVGMERRIQQIELLLGFGTQDVRTVGIWGMGGIGKTTLADAVFHRYSSQFDACVFLKDVREETEKHRLHNLRDELLRKILEEDISIGSPSIGRRDILDRISCTKVLLVLDDVSATSQIDFLLGDELQFGPGSRIIMTTRDRGPLKNRVQEDHIYEVDELDLEDALEFFQCVALRDESSRIDYANLSREVVDYAGCIPLALKVLASSFLRCNNKQDWQEELDKLKKIPNKDIQKVLRISYDGLDEDVKGIFLDIACFYKGENIDDAKRMLKMHGYFAACGIKILIDMSLISISMDSHLEMHDLLQEMAWQVDREQCLKEPGKRSRLWNADDVYRVLKNDTATSTIEVIFLDMSKIRELQFFPALFRHMHNLSLLKIYVPEEVHEGRALREKLEIMKQLQMEEEGLPILTRGLMRLRKFLFSFLPMKSVDSYDDGFFKKYWKVYLPRGLQCLPEELKYLYWSGYPLNSLPSNYSPENLVELHMPYSQVKQLWKKGQKLGNLRRLNLSHSQHLTELPDLSESPNIEWIDLSWCMSLVEVPSSFQDLVKLTYLNLQGCESVQTLSAIPCNVEFLCLTSSHHLQSVPDSICNLDHLDTLDLSGCVELKIFPPFSDGRLCSLKNLNLSYCIVLEIPDRLICLSSLQDINLSGTMIESIPESIKYVFGLRRLTCSECRNLRLLPELPVLLETLEAFGCTSLKSVKSSATALMQQPLDEYQIEALIWHEERHVYIDCVELDDSARSNIIGDAQRRIQRKASTSKRASGDSFIAICPGNEVPEWFSYKAEACSINIEFPSDWYRARSTEDPFVGFALCAVFAFPQDGDGLGELHQLRCECNFKTDNGACYKFKCESPCFWSQVTSASFQDHVLAFFQKDMFWRERNSTNPINWNKVIETSIHFNLEALRDRPCEGELCRLKVKKCGIRLLYMHA